MNWNWSSVTTGLSTPAISAAFFNDYIGVILINCIKVSVSDIEQYSLLLQK